MDLTLRIMGDKSPKARGAETGEGGRHKAEEARRQRHGSSED